MRVLVTGGAGYIGTHTVIQLARAGHTPIIADNYSNSSPEAVKRVEELIGAPVETYRVDLREKEATAEVVQRANPDAVIHFAAMKAVGESVEKPLAYYENNIGSLINVLSALEDRVLFVFSSSATVYGDIPAPYRETDPAVSASSPYGSTKIVAERILTEVSAARGTKVALLRYFNPIGAHPSGRIGENPQGVPNNLMPYITQVATGQRDHLTIFGADYPTEDGTCERDYIHVMDLADGHVAALDYLAAAGEGVRVWNLGSGRPVSVLELVNTFQEVNGVEVPYVIGDRRAGDLPAYWADATRAAEELSWRTQRSVEDMCRDSWAWQSANPRGYEG